MKNTKTPATPSPSEKYSSELVKDLLTENRFWTFWSSDWSIKINVFWKGKTKWDDVVKAVRIKMKKTRGQEIRYERQVLLQEPDLSFA